MNVVTGLEGLRKSIPRKNQRLTTIMRSLKYSDSCCMFNLQYSVQRTLNVKNINNKLVTLISLIYFCMIQKLQEQAIGI